MLSGCSTSTKAIELYGTTNPFVDLATKFSIKCLCGLCDTA